MYPVTIQTVTKVTFLHTTLHEKPYCNTITSSGYNKLGVGVGIGIGIGIDLLRSIIAMPLMNHMPASVLLQSHK